MGKHKTYTAAKQMQKLIDEYFKNCKGTYIKDDDGSVLTDKHGKPIMSNETPPTITGLALALGFNSRQTLLNYAGDPEFVDTITRAKAMVEAYAEKRLYDRDGANGAKFSLANNFKGWKDSVDLSGGIKIIMADNTDELAD